MIAPSYCYIEFTQFNYWFLTIGAVGPVRSQGNCASCYALVVAQAVETIQFLKVGGVIAMSSCDSDGHRDDDEDNDDL